MDFQSGLLPFKSHLVGLFRWSCRETLDGCSLFKVPRPPYLSLGSPRADPERQIWVRVAAPQGEPREHGEGGRRETEKGRKPISFG